MKIKCRDCENELKSKCLVTKDSIKITKSRKCNNYVYDTSRELARLERKARAMDNQDRAYKSQRPVMGGVQSETQAHPTTGDLSRFKTTAT